MVRQERHVLTVLGNTAPVDVDTLRSALSKSAENCRMNLPEKDVMFFFVQAREDKKRPEVYAEFKYGEFALHSHCPYLTNLASALGNCLKKFFPNAFIFVEAVSCDGQTRGRWNSDSSATRERVRERCEYVENQLPQLRESAKKCYCDQNILDHRGPCHHHNHLAEYTWLAEEGRRILKLEGEEFSVAADVYICYRL